MWSLTCQTDTLHNDKTLSHCLSVKRGLGFWIGFRTWIWDLVLGLGFGTFDLDLGLTILQMNFCPFIDARTLRNEDDICQLWQIIYPD